MDGSQLIELFIADVCAGKDNETPIAYRSKLTRLIRWMDAQGLQIGELTFQHMALFRRALLEQKTIRRGSKVVPGKLSPFTIHTVMRTVKHFLGWCHRNGYTHFDPSPFRIGHPPPPDPKAVTAQNALALFHAAARTGEHWERTRNLAMLYLLRDSAGRLGAILHADIDNLDLTQGKVYVREKGAKPHSLYINAPTIEALMLWLEHRHTLMPKCNALFIGRFGRALSRSGFYAIIRRLANAAELQGKGRVNPHAFRHAWVRDALQAGEDLTKVSQTLGHSTVRVTADYYARWTDGELQAAHKRFSPGAKLPVIKPEE